MSARNSASMNHQHGTINPEVLLPDDQLVSYNGHDLTTDTDNPEDVFAVDGITMIDRVLGVSPRQPYHFVSRENSHQSLVLCSGVCVNVGNYDPIACGGCAFSVRPNESHWFRLEDKGPDRLHHAQTEDRAHLRAVVAALDPDWEYGQLESLIVATDSRYVADCGATQLGIWLRNCGRTDQGHVVPDWDLWNLVITRMVDLRLIYGIRVMFWHIAQEHNRPTIRAAEAAAAVPRVSEFPRLQCRCIDFS